MSEFLGTVLAAWAVGVLLAVALERWHLWCELAFDVIARTVCWFRGHSYDPAFEDGLVCDCCLKDKPSDEVEA